ncbi:MAG: hypothetical protein C5B53_09765 [Candidatus Melainabacteria bacterium]|nr:MAG: hypothetical protein C5B53_09765 [Candidatus Melainabacteria bacterium]
MSKTAPRLVLASASPRRSQLLSNLGLQFSVLVSQVDEAIAPELSPSAAVIDLASRKALAVAEKLRLEAKNSLQQGPYVIIAADTIVVNEGKLLGKPVSKEEAINMLSSLSDKVHEVYTGIAVIVLEQGLVKAPVTKSVVSKVRFRRLEPAEIRAYVEGGEPMDKAGAYALQGGASAFVQSVEGCYTNIIGLPMPDLVAMLRDLGVPVLGC